MNEDHAASKEMNSMKHAAADEQIDEEKPAVPVESNLEAAADEVQRGGEEPSIEDQLKEAEAKAAEYLDGWQRARAEFANARKRLERGRVEAYNAAGIDFVTKLLPIVDDLGRARDSAPPEIVENPWFEGLDLVTRKLGSMLESMDVWPIEAVGEPFDPNFHEALSLREADGVESGIVIEELQTGYRMGDKVIRPSLVNVAA